MVEHDESFETLGAFVSSVAVKLASNDLFALDAGNNSRQVSIQMVAVFTSDTNVVESLIGHAEWSGSFDAPQFLLAPIISVDATLTSEADCVLV